MATELRFRPQQRVRAREDFERIFARRVNVRDDVLLIFGVMHDLPHARLGLSVSRKVGNAVVRNRWKRLLREAFRQEQHFLPTGLDLVVVPMLREEPTLARLRPSLVRLARKLAGKIARMTP